LSLGKNIHIGRHSEIMAEGGVTIGDNVVISFHCVLWSIDHRYEGESVPYDKARIRRPIVIHDNVWIGRNVIVRGGVTIGEGAVVAMGSVVTRDVPPLAVMGGNPARVLKFRDAGRYAKSKAEGRSLWREDDGVCGACQAPDFFLLDPVILRRSLTGRIWGALVARWRHFIWRFSGGRDFKVR
jgi:maltose O-acetyltransferase